MKLKLNYLKDVLYYTHSASGASVERAQGVVIGVLSALMATGMDFDKAFHTVQENLPKTLRQDAIPLAYYELMLPNMERQNAYL
jgi:hypothetical protein